MGPFKLPHVHALVAFDTVQLPVEDWILLALPTLPLPLSFCINNNGQAGRVEIYVPLAYGCVCGWLENMLECCSSQMLSIEVARWIERTLRKDVSVLVSSVRLCEGLWIQDCTKLKPLRARWLMLLLHHILPTCLIFQMGEAILQHNVSSLWGTTIIE